MDHFNLARSLGGGKSGDLHTLRELSMKKFTAMLLTLCFTLMIVGCGDEAKSTKKVETKTTETSKPASK
jgi:hypothetical protein